MGAVGLGEYDARWPDWFAEIRDALPPGLRIEHVGSTSVPGLSAKPIIDVDVVIESTTDIAATVRLLETAGWIHEGDLGIRGREAFKPRPGLPAHHLYVVVAGSEPHRDHIDLRDLLRRSPAHRHQYEEAKRAAAVHLPHDRLAYQRAKEPMIELLIDAARRDPSAPS